MGQVRDLNIVVGVGDLRQNVEAWELERITARGGQEVGGEYREGVAFPSNGNAGTSSSRNLGNDESMGKNNREAELRPIGKWH